MPGSASWRATVWRTRDLDDIVAFTAPASGWGPLAFSS